MGELEPWSIQWKHDRLKHLFQAWQDCTRCRLSDTRTQIVFGNGNPNADIMFIGIGPGEHEDEQGNVFVGESGLLLNALLQAAKIDREDLFITNLVKCRPPGNRDPMNDETKACFELLHEQIYIVDPMLIVPIGAEPMKSLMGSAWKSITKEHGKMGWIEIPGLVEDGIRYPAMPVLHPSFINREDKINRQTKNWERGGWAEKTYKDFERARIRVDELKRMYNKPAKRSMSNDTRARRGLRVL